MAACVGGLGAGVWANDEPATAVLVLSRTVPKGDVIAAGDLVVAEVLAPGVIFVPASSKPQVVGQRAMSTLPAGSLLGPNAYGTPLLPAGVTQVSLRLGPSQVPSCELPGGTRLILIGLPAIDELDEKELLVIAEVVFPPVAMDDGTVQLDVAIDATSVNGLAPYLLDGRVSVVAIE